MDDADRHHAGPRAGGDDRAADAAEPGAPATSAPAEAGDAAGIDEWTGDGELDGPGRGDGEIDGAGARGSRRPWFRRLGIVVPIGVVGGMFGLFFVGFAAALMLITDRDRQRDARIGGAVLLLWWLWTWTLPGTAPLVGAALLGTAVVFLARATWALRPPARYATGALALGGVVLAGLALFPHGVRGPAFGEDEALRAALTARRGNARNVDASQADVVLTRERFTNRPYYFVVLHEQNPERRVTGDGEPCFRRAEVHLVDARSRAVTRQGITESLPEDGNCLPLRVGTKADLVPVVD